jgi:ribA/ribD-fused uncharacterized protein
MQGIYGFFGEHRWLSNFVNGSVPIEMDGMVYATVEAAYQAAKTLDMSARQVFIDNPDPRFAKKQGRTLVLRSDWDQVRLTVMEACLQQKFQCPQLRKALLKTYPYYLEETNTWRDTYWGVCNGIGENQLGRLLMNIREAARKELTGS